MEKAYKIDLPDRAKKLLSLLESNGYEANIVGGCVRDSLMGIVPKDWDICTSALPSEMKEVFSGYPTIETGLKHGTLTVLIEGEPFEITTYRIDGKYSDHRRPDQVTFSQSLADDLSRRDFTINAIAYNPKAGLFDPFDGQADISRRLIRCVGDPVKRFKEDGLRIMRALRFAAVTGFAIDPATFAAAKANKKLLSKIAAERIYTEFCKLICGDNCKSALDDGRKIIAVIIPEIRDMFGFEQQTPHHIYDVWRHTLNSVSIIDNELVLRLTMFFHDIGKPHTFSVDKKNIGHFYGHTRAGMEITLAVLRRLHSDNATSQAVQELIRWHSTHIHPDPVDVKKWLNRLGEERLRQLIAVKKADTTAKGLRPETKRRLADLELSLSLINDVIERGECFSLKDLAVNGTDLKMIGITEGKMIGITLNRLLKKVIEGELDNEKNTLLQKAKL